MPLKAWITTTAEGDEHLHQYTRELVERCTARLRATTNHPRFRAAETPDTADIILFIEEPLHKFRDYAHRLLKQDLIRKYPNRCFGYDWEDGPAGFLPGVYPSLLRRKMNPARFRTGGFLELYNSRIAGVLSGMDPAAREPRYLLGFRGSASSDLRHRLFAAADRFPADISIARIDKWFDHTHDEQESYVRDLCGSKFVLCPRGIGTATFRQFEAMAVGRAPVILSDEWVPPMGPPWSDCAIWVAEDRYAELPEIVGQYASQWRERGQAAEAAWHDWFAPDIVLFRTLQSIEDILLRRSVDHDERVYQEQWLGWQFAHENGWTLPQKMLSAWQEGTVVKRARGKLARLTARPPAATA